MKARASFLLMNLCWFSSFAQVAIDINIQDGDSLKIRYLRPFEEFANEDAETTLGDKVSGRTLITFDNSQPIFVRFIFNNSVIELLCEPSDTIRLTLKDPTSHKHDWLSIDGRNSAGHLYYNMVYNRVRIDKFFKIRDVFERSYQIGSDTLILRVKREIERQLGWLDSLKNSNLVSQPFYEMMKVQISTLLAWEVGEQCNKYLELRDPLSWESSEIKMKLFAQYDPLDHRLRSCLSKGYYYTYFEQMYKAQSKCDTSEIIVGDTPFYCLAPLDLQGYLWGASLIAHYKYDPDQEKNCRTFKMYEAKFGTAPFVEYLRNSTICRKEEKNAVKIITPFDADLFTLLTFSFPGKRVFIDLWATWCAPCKAEFKHYDSSFYRFMSDRKIELVYVSIDKIQDKKRWEKDVGSFNLSGFHILAGKKLQSSIKDVIFDGGNAVIPRYILVSEDGRILSVDFKRPSDPLFENEIYKAFARKR